MPRWKTKRFDFNKQRRSPAEKQMDFVKSKKPKKKKLKKARALALKRKKFWVSNPELTALFGNYHSFGLFCWKNKLPLEFKKIVKKRLERMPQLKKY